MSAKILQMGKAKPAAEDFHRTVETVEPAVTFEVRSIADVDGDRRMCQVNLTNKGPRGRTCLAFLASENVDTLIGALNSWKALL